MMAEVVSRRFARAQPATTAGSYDEGFASIPNLVVIDGGKGQLSAALAAMQAYDLPRVAVIALAKREEEVFVPGRPEPIVLDAVLAGPPAPPADPRRGAPLRARLPPPAARVARARVDPRRATRRRAGPPPRAYPALRLAGADPRRGSEELEGVPGVPAKTGRQIYAALHKAGEGLGVPGSVVRRGEAGFAPARAVRRPGVPAVVAVIECASKPGAEAAFRLGLARATSYTGGSAPPRAPRRPDPNPLSCSCTSDCSWRLLAERELGRGARCGGRISPRRSAGACSCSSSAASSSLAC